MVSRFFVYALPLCLALLAGPLGFALNAKDKPDPAHLYLVLGSQDALTHVLNASEVKEIGPYQARHVKIVQGTEDFHHWLVDGGYWIFPASALAELCGLNPVS